MADTTTAIRPPEKLLSVSPRRVAPSKVKNVCDASAKPGMAPGSQIGAQRYDQVIIRDLRGAGPHLPLDGVDAQNFRLDQFDAPAQKPCQRPMDLMRLTISRHEPEE